MNSSGERCAKRHRTSLSIVVAFSIALLGIVVSPTSAHAGALTLADNFAPVANLVTNAATADTRDVPANRGLVPFKPYRKTFPIGNWRATVRKHRVKVVVMYANSLEPLQRTVSATAAAGAFWAREVPGLRFQFSSPKPMKASRAVMCNTGRAWKAAMGKKKRLGKNQHLLVIAPECGGGWGYGSVGAGSGKAYSMGNEAETIAHELGHNLGFLHANSVTCWDAAGQQVPLSKRCNEEEYGDGEAIMGGASREARLGPLGQALLTKNVRRVKEGATTQVTVSNPGRPGRRLVIVKSSLGNIMFDMSPRLDGNPMEWPGGVEARVTTRPGSAAILTLPDQQGNMSGAADNLLQAGESWRIPGSSLKVTVLAVAVNQYATLRFSPA